MGNQVPAYLGRRIQHHKFNACTSLSFKPGATEQAGLLILKNESAQYFFAVGKDKIQLIQTHKKAQNVLAEKPFKLAKNVWLKVDSDGIACVFSYSTDGQTWDTLADNVDASTFSCERTSGFTGATIGLYAVNNE